MSSLLPYQQAFIQLAMEHGVLTFGHFTLKSGRKSPYFFNAGLFYQASALQKLGEYYAQAILDANLSFDVLYGPAYKGIPLAVTTGIALSQKGYDYPLAFNRKEAKTHGEGGNLMGAPLSGRRVLILDDVITAGTAFYESKQLIEAEGASIAGMVVALDRQEKGKDGFASGLQEIKKKENISTVSLITLENLIFYFKNCSSLLSPEVLHDLLVYRAEYGVGELI